MKTQFDRNSFFFQHYSSSSESDEELIDDLASDQSKEEAMETENHVTINANNKSSQDDEYITIGVSEWKAKWRFPEQSFCPHSGCVTYFASRKEALKHYQKSHAAFSVLCQLCGKITSQKYFATHFKQIHPFEQVPFRFDSQVII